MIAARPRRASSFPPRRRIAAALTLAGSLAISVSAAQSPDDPGGAEPPASGTRAGDEVRLIISPDELGRPSTAPAGEMTGIEAAEVGVLKLWFERQRAMQRGDADAALLAVRKMEALMDREGIRGMEFLAGAFTHEGYEHVMSGNYLRAQESFQMALRFDPSLPPAYLGLAEARRLAGEGLPPYFQEKLRGLTAGLGNFWWTYILLSNALFQVLAGLTAFALLFALIMAYRHNVEWRHDISEFFQGRGFSERGARLAAWFVFFLPALLWISSFWILLYWVVGTVRYMRRAEKTIAVLVVAYSLLAWPGLGFLLTVFKVTDSPTVKATVSALKGGYEPEKVKYIQQILRKRPDDPTLYFLLASVVKDGGNLVEAFQHYRKVIELEPDNYRAYNNIGNIYFATSQFGEAVSWYRQATDLNPSFAIGFFNTNLAQKEQFHFTEANESLERARSLDAEAVAVFLGRAGDAAATPVDAKIPMSEAWFEVVRGRSGRSGEELPRLARAGFLNPLSIVSGLGLLAMIYLGVTGLKTRPRLCPRCGGASCSRCQKEGKELYLCAQCTHVFILKEDVSPEVRAQKLVQIARFEARSTLVRRAAAFLVPGAGHLLVGRTLRGVFLILLWGMLGIHLLVSPELLDFPASPYVTSSAMGFYAILGGLVLVWVLGVIGGFTRARD